MHLELSMKNFIRYKEKETHCYMNLEKFKKQRINLDLISTKCRYKKIQQKKDRMNSGKSLVKLKLK